MGARDGDSEAGACKARKKRKTKKMELEMKTMDVSNHGTALTRVKNLSQQTYAVIGTNCYGITSVR